MKAEEKSSPLPKSSSHPRDAVRKASPSRRWQLIVSVALWLVFVLVSAALFVAALNVVGPTMSVVLNMFGVVLLFGILVSLITTILS